MLLAYAARVLDYLPLLAVPVDLTETPHPTSASAPSPSCGYELAPFARIQFVPVDEVIVNSTSIDLPTVLRILRTGTRR